MPESECIYKIPDNWVWTYCEFIFDIAYGKGLSTKELKDEGYPVFGANGYIGFHMIDFIGGGMSEMNNEMIIKEYQEYQDKIGSRTSKSCQRVILCYCIGDWVNRR